MSVHTATQPAEPDLMLLHRFIETGDGGAFAEIVRRYAGVVYSSSLRILGDQGRAQDVSQETFFRLMQRPRLVTHSLAGWLHRTATRLALDVRRSEKSRRQREQTYGLEYHQSKSGRPSWAEVSPFVDQALNEIKEPVRGLLIRYFLQSVPQAELAEELDVSPATLSRRVKSGLEELQQILKNKGIYLGAAVLAGFFSSSAHAAVPVGFVSELGKMNLVASMRHLPAAAAPASPMSPYPCPFKIRPQTRIFVPAKFAAVLIAISLVIAAYAFATAASWMRSQPASPQLVQPSEPR